VVGAAGGDKEVLWCNGGEMVLWCSGVEKVFRWHLVFVAVGLCG
jgi:hypothetical protein